MYHHSPATSLPAPVKSGGFDAIRVNMAMAMIGQTVDLMADAHRITHGIVAGVITEAGIPKLVVGRRIYDLSQMLTATPTPLN